MAVRNNCSCGQEFRTRGTSDVRVSIECASTNFDTRRCFPARRQRALRHAKNASSKECIFADFFTAPNRWLRMPSKFIPFVRAPGAATKRRSTKSGRKRTRANRELQSPAERKRPRDKIDRYISRVCRVAMPGPSRQSEFHSYAERWTSNQVRISRVASRMHAMPAI